jgi:hypothetical protein
VETIGSKFGGIPTAWHHFDTCSDGLNASPVKEGFKCLNEANELVWFAAKPSPVAKGHASFNADSPPVHSDFRRRVNLMTTSQMLMMIGLYAAALVAVIYFTRATRDASQGHWPVEQPQD